MSYTKDGVYEGESLDRSGLYEKAQQIAFDLYQALEGKMQELKGEEWVKAHPGVIAQLAMAASIDYNHAVDRIRLQEIEKRLNAIASLDM